MAALRRARATALSLAARVADAVTPKRGVLPLARLRGTASPVAKQAMVRALAGGTSLGEGVLLARALGRYKLLLAADDLAHAPHLLADGFWEWGTTAWLLRHLRPEDRVVDGGAGYGFFSILAAELVGPEGSVVAYEASPRIAALCRQSVALNGLQARVNVRAVALAHGVGARPLRLSVRTGDPLGGRLDPADLAAGQATGLPRPDQMPVAAVSLAAAGLERPDVIKLDVPGAEDAVVRDLPALFADAPGLRVLLAFEASRSRAPAELLEAIAALAPLRRLDAAGVAQSCDAATLLRGGESMLLISSPS